jgi:hypothetical protein
MAEKIYSLLFKLLEAQEDVKITYKITKGTKQNEKDQK